LCRKAICFFNIKGLWVGDLLQPAMTLALLQNGSAGFLGFSLKQGGYGGYATKTALHRYLCFGAHTPEACMKRSSDFSHFAKENRCG